MTQPIPGRIFRTINIGGHYAIQISPCNNCPKHDASFVHSLDIVADPGDRIGNARIYSNSSEERACVGDVRISCCHEHCESGATDTCKRDIPNTSPPGSICSETDKHSLD